MEKPAINNRIDLIRQMLAKEPDDSFLNYALALELAKNNQQQEAIAIIERIVVRDKSYLGCYYQLGKLYEQIQQKEKAIATYKKGILLAQQQKNTKTLNELNAALMMIEEE